MVASACPAADSLQSYLLGSLLDEDAERLEAHIYSCPRCLSALPKLEVEDGLLLALRSQRGRPRFNNPLMDQLRLKLRQLQPARPADPFATIPDADDDRPPF